MEQEPQKDKCPRNFKLYTALVLGMGCMVIILATIDSLHRGITARYEGVVQHNVQTVASVSEAGENNPIATPWLGIETQDIDETIARQLGLRNSNGVLVTKVLQESPADYGGIKRGDVIVKFDHRSIKDASFLQYLIADLFVGQRVQVVVVRNEDYKSLYVKTGVAPASYANAASMLEGVNTDLYVGSGVLQWGIEVSPLTATLAQSLGVPESKGGVLVVQVQPGARAASAGLQSGDVIMSVNSSPIPDMSTFISAISSAQEAVFDIVRDDENLYLIAY